MDAEMEDAFEVGGDRGLFEVDLDYEFDAARFFDLGRPETPEETREAERWFEGAVTYPPSPFVSKNSMVIDLLKEKANAHPTLKDEAHELDRSCNGTISDKFDIQEVISIGKESFSQCPTLLKNAESQLVWKNKSLEPRSSKLHPHRFQKSSSVLKPITTKVEIMFGGVSESKRRKLDEGCAQKVYHLHSDVNLLHKCPQKKNEPRAYSSENSRSKLTIPRAPELRTAKRADRVRSGGKNVEQQHVSTAIFSFKARPLNKKILEGPLLPLPRRTIPKPPVFQEFRLKTSERAAQQSILHLSMSADNLEKAVPHSSGNESEELYSQPCADTAKLHIYSGKNGFIPSKLNDHRGNPEVLSSSGDIDIFHCNRKEITKQVAFSFANEKRHRPLPPTELFNKLTLESRVPQNSNPAKFVQPYHAFVKCKESKENMMCSNMTRRQRQKE